MSEPVGNSPRARDELPGNSHKERAERERESLETREPMNKVVEGNVTTRKKPWYKRWGRSLFAEDVHSMGDWVVAEVILPSLRDLIRNTIVGGLDRGLYGTARNSRTSAGERPGLRTRYDLMSDRDREPRRGLMSREARVQHNFSDIILEHQSDAVTVIEGLIDRCDRYGAVSVADLYDAVGETGSYADLRWGWNRDDLRFADVRPVPGGFLLDLPRPRPIR